MSALQSSLCILASGVLWGLLPLFAKYLIGEGFSPEQIVFTRVLFSAVMLVSWLGIFRPSALRIRLADVWCFAGMGICSIMLFTYCYFRTIETANIALAALLLYTSPIFILFFSMLFFRERMTKRKLLAVGCTFAGCACITGILTHGAPAVPWSVIAIGLGAGLFYSLYTIFGKYAVLRYSSVTITTHAFIFAAIGTAFLVPLPETMARYADPAIFLVGCGIAVFCSLGAFGLYTVGLAGVAPSKAGVLATVEPVVATLIGVFVFHEDAGIATVVGMVLILGATVLLSKPETD